MNATTADFRDFDDSDNNNDINDIFSALPTEPGKGRVNINLCDNPIYDGIQQIKQIWNDIEDFFKFVKTQFDRLMDFLNPFPEMLKVLKSIIPTFYCAKQASRHIALQAAPYLDVALEATRKDAEGNPIPAPTKDTVAPKEVLVALVNLRTLMQEVVNANLIQVEENEQARFNDLYRQLADKLPRQQPTTVIEEIQPVQGIEPIKPVEVELVDAENETVHLEPLAQLKQIHSVIANLPGRTPLSPRIPEDIVPDEKTTTQDLIEFVNRLGRKSLLEGLDNNAKTLDQNNVLRYQALRTLIDRVGANGSVDTGTRIRPNRADRPGGSNTGGSNTGGSNTGGSNTGGSNTGGSNTGGGSGSSTGGSNTGGSGSGSGSRGNSTGGGSNTGGGGNTGGGTTTGGHNKPGGSGSGEPPLTPPPIPTPPPIVVPPIPTAPPIRPPSPIGEPPIALTESEQSVKKRNTRNRKKGSKNKPGANGA